MMQNKARGAVLMLLMSGLLAAPIAEAKRAGGGKSVGMSRSQNSSQSYNQNNNSQFRQQQAAPAPVAQQPQRSDSNVGGMVAAGVAGAAIGAVAANAMADDTPNQADPSQQAADWQNGEAAAQQEEKASFNWLWIAVLAAGAFFLFRKFSAKKKLATVGSNRFSPNHNATTRTAPNAPFGQPNAGANTNIFGQSVGGTASPAPQAPFGAATTMSGQQLPDGTEPANFLRFARQRFNHIQAMNNAANIREIEKYFTPDMYQAIYSEISGNDEVAEFSNLTANVVEQTTENDQYIVSVRFTGTVSEDLNSLPQPFTEVWHFVKPVGSQNEWVVAGIEQA